MSFKHSQKPRAAAGRTVCIVTHAAESKQRFIIFFIHSGQSYKGGGIISILGVESKVQRPGFPKVASLVAETRTQASA